MKIIKNNIVKVYIIQIKRTKFDHIYTFKRIKKTRSILLI